MWADPDADYDKIGDAAGRARGQDRRRRRLGPRPQRRDRHGRAALPARRRRRHDAVRRRAAPRRAVPAAAAAPTCCCSTSRPTTSTPSASPGWSASSRTTRARSSPSPTTATSSTTSPSGSSSSTAAAAIPFEGNYSSWLEQKQDRLAQEEKGVGPRSARSPASSSGCAWHRRPARPRARPASPPTRSCWPRPRPTGAAGRRSRSSIPPGPRLGDRSSRSRALAQGVRRPAADRGPLVLAAAGRHRRRHRPERRRQDDAVPHDHRSGAARRRRRSRSATTVQLAYVDQSRDTLDADSTVYEEITGGIEHPQGRRPRDPRPGVRRRLQLQGHRPAEAGRRPVGRRAQPGAPGQDAATRAATSCCSTSRPTTSTSTRCAPSRTALESFPGCAVVISHDRWFLDRIATHVLAFEGDSQVRWFEGNFTEYEAVPPQGARRRRRPAPPHQVQAARPLTSPPDRPLGDFVAPSRPK